MATAAAIIAMAVSTAQQKGAPPAHTLWQAHRYSSNPTVSARTAKRCSPSPSVSISISVSVYVFGFGCRGARPPRAAALPLRAGFNPLYIPKNYKPAAACGVKSPSSGGPLILVPCGLDDATTCRSRTCRTWMTINNACRSPIYRSIYLSPYLCSYPPIYLSIHTPIYLSTHPPIHQPIHLSTYPST